MAPAPGQTVCHHCTIDPRDARADHDAELPPLPSLTEHRNQTWPETVPWALSSNNEELHEHRAATQAYGIVGQSPYWAIWREAEGAHAEDDTSVVGQDIAIMSRPFIAGVVNKADSADLRESRPQSISNAHQECSRIAGALADLPPALAPQSVAAQEESASIMPHIASAQRLAHAAATAAQCHSMLFGNGPQTVSGQCRQEHRWCDSHTQTTHHLQYTSAECACCTGHSTTTGCPFRGSPGTLEERSAIPRGDETPAAASGAESDVGQIDRELMERSSLQRTTGNPDQQQAASDRRDMPRH